MIVDSRKDKGEQQISGIIADEMAIGMVNQKTTAVRVIPVIGKDVGEVAEFGVCSAMHRLCR